MNIRTQEFTHPHQVPYPVVGIDPSLTSTAMALSSGVIYNFRTTGKADDPYPTRLDRITEIATGVGEHLPADGLVVMEGPSFNSTSTSMWERAALWYAIMKEAIGAGCDVAVAPPVNVKMWATGAVSASKAAMISAARRSWGIVPLNDDCADALAMMGIGIHLTLGQDAWPLDGKRGRALEKVAICHQK